MRPPVVDRWSNVQTACSGGGRECRWIETGARAVIGAVFGPTREGETSYATRLLHHLGPEMLVLWDRGFDGNDFLAAVHATGAQILGRIRQRQRRRPPVLRPLADSSYLSVIGGVPVRIIEARVRGICTDGTAQRYEWNEFMAAVIAMLEELRGLAPLTAEGAAARFSAQEWTPGGKPRDGVETSWDTDGVGGWIQTFSGGAVSVSFAVWIRDVDESGYFDDVEAVYEQGEQALAGFLPEIEESPLAGHLVEAEQTAADKDEFIKVKKWTLDGRILTAGVIQQDADLPVMVVVALEESTPA